MHAWPGPHTGADPPPRLPEDTIPRVEAVLEIIAIAAGVHAPKVAAIVDDAPNCLTVGRSAERAWLVVTTGLVESLSKRELEAVLAYELGRVVELEVSFDTVVYASTARGFEVWVAAFSDVHHLTPLLVPLALLATPFLLASIALRGVALRNRAALADGLAVRYCRNPGALARALRTILDDPTMSAGATRAPRTCGSSTRTAVRRAGSCARTGSCRDASAGWSGGRRDRRGAPARGAEPARPERSASRAARRARPAIGAWSPLSWSRYS